MSDGRDIHIDFTGISVMLGMPVHRGLDWPVVQSLLETQDLMRELKIPFDIVPCVGGDTVITARDKIAHGFLKTRHTRLVMVDSDVTWAAKDCHRLVALSTVMDCVAGIYPHRADPIRFFLNMDEKFGEPVKVNEYGCIAVKGLGLGFTVVTRAIIEKLTEKAPKVRFIGYPEPIAKIFHDGVVDGEWQGEDMAFFEDVRNLGHVVNLDPSITLGHIGSKTYTASIMDFLKPAAPPAQASAA